MCVPRSTASTMRELHARRECLALIGGQDSERVRPQVLDGGAELRRVGQPVAPHLGVHAVIGLLPVDLRGEAGDLRVVVLHQRRDADLVGLLVEPAAHDRVAPVEQSQLDEGCAAVLVERAVECECICVIGEELVHRARMSDLVLRDRRERDVLLEQRRDARPLGVSPADDELVVSQPEKKLVHALPSVSL